MDDKDFELLINLFFGKDTQEQFFKECKELGIIEDEEEEN